MVLYHLILIEPVQVEWLDLVLLLWVHGANHMWVSVILSSLKQRRCVMVSSLPNFMDTKHAIMEVDCWNTRHSSRVDCGSYLVEIGELVHDFSFFVIQHVNR